MPTGGGERDGDAEAAAGASCGGGSEVRDGAGGSGALGVFGGGGTGVDVPGAGGGAVTGAVVTGGVAGAVGAGAVPGAATGVVLLESALPGSAAAGRPGSPGTDGPAPLGASFSFPFSFSPRSPPSP